ncbi:MAG TPA: type II toxin-antitoxin system VapC family toxin [Beutenbergiaceae bacterium]|nr:type II toxin-antitoxin system VapC family toxin [Beutenbergiaceae bacterium]
MAFVLDTSVTMAWCFADESTPATEALLDQLVEQEAWVPPLWHLEVVNVLLVAERRGRLSQAQSERFLELLAALPIRTADSSPEAAQLLGLGRHHRLSAYDAAYLALAGRHGLPLATGDRGLAEACQAAGVEALRAA